ARTSKEGVHGEETSRCGRLARAGSAGDANYAGWLRAAREVAEIACRRAIRPRDTRWRKVREALCEVGRDETREGARFALEASGNGNFTMLLPNGLLEIGGLGVQMIPSKVARAKRRRTAIVSRQRAFMSDRRGASV